jgi:nucleoside-diphosphate-sugar epimerase
MKVLITGGSGFIGSHTISYARTLDWEIHSIDLNPDSDYVSDIRHFDWKGIGLSDYDAVIHLAARISVPESFEIPETYREVNVTATEGLFSACVEAGVPRVIFSSSAAVYGSSEKEVKRVGEESPPESPYAQTKLDGEGLAASLAPADTSFTVFRLFNVYGPNQSADSPYASVIPKFVDRICRGDSVTIHGDGSQTRDFVHVSDVSRTVLSAAEQTDAPSFDIVNLGTGSGISILEFSNLLSLIVSEEGGPSESTILHGPPREGDIRHSVADLSGLNPYASTHSFVPFEDGIRELVRRALNIN